MLMFIYFKLNKQGLYIIWWNIKEYINIFLLSGHVLF